MIRKELKKEAEEKASVYFNSLDIDNGNVSDTPFSAARAYRNDNEKLKAQIEKMKCCGNCDWKVKGICNDNDNCELEDWKLVETWR